eukprot:Partr_v1_DN28418_c0_g1_i1_m42093 putative guanine nucleotide exchange factor
MMSDPSSSSSSLPMPQRGNDDISIRVTDSQTAPRQHPLAQSSTLYLKPSMALTATSIPRSELSVNSMDSFFNQEKNLCFLSSLALELVGAVPSFPCSLKIGVEAVCGILPSITPDLALLILRSLVAIRFLVVAAENNAGLTDIPERITSDVWSSLSIQPRHSLSVYDMSSGSAGGDSSSQLVPESIMDGLSRPNGVVTQLTGCYSPSCNSSTSSTAACYSSSCPNAAASKFKSTKSMAETARARIQSPTKSDAEELWASSVPKEIIESVSEAVRRRQEIIYEIIKTEQEYVTDLKTLKLVYLDPLVRSDIVSKDTRSQFVTQVFGNLIDVITVNSELLHLLIHRQKSQHVVSGLGDLFREWLNSSTHSVDSIYSAYGENQPLSKHLVDFELRTNPLFDTFLQVNMRLPECRKLPIQSFLARPTTRLGRYPIMLSTLIKKTEDPREIHDLDYCMETLKGILDRVNQKAGNAQNQVRIKNLRTQFTFKSEEQERYFQEMIDFSNNSRAIIREGTMLNSDNSEVELLLLDNCLIIAKKKAVNGVISYILKRDPVPLLLLTVDESTSNIESASLSRTDLALKSRQDLHGGRNSLQINSLPSSPPSGAKSSFDMILKIHGANSASMTLMASFAAVKQWIYDISVAKAKVGADMNIYKLQSLICDDVGEVENSELLHNNPILSSAEYEGMLFVGTEQGLFSGSSGNLSTFFKILPTKRVSQLEFILEPDYKLLLILTEHDLISVRVDEVSSAFQNRRILKTKKISSHISFFKFGENHGEKYLFVVKSKLVSSSTSIKAYSFAGSKSEKKRKSLTDVFRRLSSNVNDSEFESRREIYIPSGTKSLFILKTKICVGSSQGFELIDINTLETQTLVDASDTSLAILQSKKHLYPLFLAKVTAVEFLICYTDFGIYIDAQGRNSRPLDPVPHVKWHGAPHSFCSDEEYLLAFDSSIIEVRLLSDGSLRQVIILENVSLASSTFGIHVSTMKSNDDSGSSRIRHGSISMRKKSRSISESTKFDISDFPVDSGSVSSGTGSAISKLLQQDSGSSRVSLEGKRTSDLKLLLRSINASNGQQVPSMLSISSELGDAFADTFMTRPRRRVTEVNEADVDRDDSPDVSPISPPTILIEEEYDDSANFVPPVTMVRLMKEDELQTASYEVSESSFQDDP